MGGIFHASSLSFSYEDGLNHIQLIMNTNLVKEKSILISIVKVCGCVLLRPILFWILGYLKLSFQTPNYCYNFPKLVSPDKKKEKKLQTLSFVHLKMYLWLQRIIFVFSFHLAWIFVVGWGLILPFEERKNIYHF